MYATHYKLYFAVCDDPANGGVTNVGTEVGATATFYCDYGYDLIGNITCQSSGNWSGSPPTCEGL